MHTLKICLRVIILLSAVLSGTTQAFQTGSPVVHFSLKNLDTGNPVTPEQYKGQVLVLFFLGHN